MKIVLHIGSEKAGSASIQASLLASRPFLLNARILVPDTNGDKLDQRDLANMLFGRGDAAYAAGLFADIDRQRRDHDPDVLILSSEYVWSQPRFIPQIKALLNTWSSDIQVILYLRDPVSFYRSVQQQRLKSTHVLFDPAVWKTEYSRHVQDWRRAFGAALTLVPFQKSAFQGGDLVRDFLVRTCGAIADAGAGIQVIRSNEAEYAEVSCIMQRYFAANYASGEKVRMNRKGIDALRRALQTTAQSAGIGTSPVIIDPVRATILFNHRQDLQELREVHGISFDAIDYAGLMACNPALAFDQPPDFGDLVGIDATVMRRLEYQVLHAFVERAVRAKGQESDR